MYRTVFVDLLDHFPDFAPRVIHKPGNGSTANIAAEHCKGGLCAYIPKQSSQESITNLATSPFKLEGITHQPPRPLSRSTWILETLMPQIRKINAIFAMFRVFSIIWISSEKILVG
jgi:hypothetical protein